MYAQIIAQGELARDARRELEAVARRIEKGDALLLLDGGAAATRRFLREGDLVKLCRSQAKRKTYRFFLFSDQLLYTHKTPHGEFRVHEQLLLSV